MKRTKGIPGQSGSKGYGKTAKVGVAWGVFRDTLKQVIFVPGLMVLARILSPEDFGISAAAVMVITLANRLGTLGLNSALVRLKTITPAHLSTVFTYNLGMGAVAFTVLQFAAPAIAAFYRRPEVGDAIRVAGVSFLFVPFGAINSAMFQREMRFKQTAISEWTFAVVFPIVAVTLAWFGFGFWSIVYGQLTARASQVAVKVYQGRWVPRLHFSAAAFRRSHRLGPASPPTGCSAFPPRTWTASSSDGCSASPHGFYDKAFNTMTNLSERLVVDPGVTFRIFAIISEDQARSPPCVSEGHLSTALLGLPFFSMIVMAPELIVVMYGRQWTRTIVPFQLLCIVGALRVANGYSSAAILAKGYAWAGFGRNIIRNIVLVTALYALQPWGIVGAAAAVVCAAFSSVVMTQTLLNRLVGLRWSQLAAPMLPGLACMAIVVPALITVEIVLRSIFGTPSDLHTARRQGADGGRRLRGFSRELPHFGNVRRCRRVPV